MEEINEPGRGGVTAKVKEIAGRTHYLPGKGPITVSERTVYEWSRLFRQGGIEALRPRWRKDKGKSRKISDAILERAVKLREENPNRWTSTIIDILKLEGSLHGPAPHRSTFDRHFDKRSASRRRMRGPGDQGLEEGWGSRASATSGSVTITTGLLCSHRTAVRPRPSSAPSSTTRLATRCSIDTTSQKTSAPSETRCCEALLGMGAAEGGLRRPGLRLPC